jgi:coenzyme F420-reducing hydrogenase gamma subunit
MFTQILEREVIELKEKVRKTCAKENPKFLHEDDQYTACSTCKARCDQALKCKGCGTVDGVFYKKSRYDLFLCGACYHKAEESQESNQSR